MTTVVDVPAQADTAELRIGDKVLTLPVEQAVAGQSAINIGSLLKDGQVTTLDYGFANTASTRSAITYLDGDAGHPALPRLPDRAAGGALDLPRDRLPADLRRAADGRAQLDDVDDSRSTRHTLLHEEFKRFFDGFPMDAHPMGILASAVAALSTFYQDSDGPARRRGRRDQHHPPDRQDADDRGLRLQEVDRPAVHLPGQRARLREQLPADDVRGARPSRTPSTPTRRARCASCSSCTPTTSRTAPPRRCGWSARATPTCSPRSRPGSPRCGARSTAAPTRRSWRCSRRSTPTAATSRKYVDAGEGPGRPVPADGLRPPRLQELRPAGRRSSRRPRTRCSRSWASHDPLLDIALELEEVALSDPYFIERKLYPNVDFYSGLIYRALGFPMNMFTVLFAIGGCPAGSPTGAR